jgi:signal transduction histidine kinase
VSRVPIRLRLTVVFAATMLLVLAVTGGFVYARFRSELDRTIDLNLRTQAAALVPLIGSSSSGLAQVVDSPLVRGHETFVQVVAASGRIIAATPGLRASPLLSDAQLEHAMKQSLFFTRGSLNPLPEGSRLLATPVHPKTGGPVVLIVGATLDERSSALSDLAVLLAIVGPLALIVASLGGYWLASAALRPVELMRRRAAAVSASEPGLRLPLPPADDEVRRLGFTLNEMLSRLEASLARERTFVANASHELRTPLATVKAELDLALRRERSADELRRAMGSVEAEVDRLSALADDLLVLARADDGQLPIRRTDLKVADLLGSVAQRFDPAGGHIRIDAPAGMRVLADPQRLEQALDNLLDNATRYASGEATLRAIETAAGVELHVEDNGPGFPPGFADRAFERFARADPSRSGPGAGLGLALVRTIANAHGGDALAANRVQGGADVWIVIPREKQP